MSALDRGLERSVLGKIVSKHKFCSKVLELTRQGYDPQGGSHQVGGYKSDLHGERLSVAMRVVVEVGRQAVFNDEGINLKSVTPAIHGSILLYSSANRTIRHEMLEPRLISLLLIS
jgi:hypothetical protein